MVGIEIRRAQYLPISTFPYAPHVIPDGRISRVRLAIMDSHWVPSLAARSLSARSHPPLPDVVCLPGCPPGRPSSRVLPVVVSVWLHDREPLCSGGRYPSFIAPTGSCARPSASAPPCCALWGTVCAGCCEPLLAGGRSRRYLCNPCIGAWTPTPQRSCSASARSFPHDTGLTSESTGSARHTSPQCYFHGGNISGLQSVRYVQAPILARPPGSTHR
jgi:hypothetical protein